MSLFLERTETNGRVVIRYWPWWRYVIVGCLFAVALTNDFTDGDATLTGWSAAFGGIAMVSLFANLAATWSSRRELRSAMREGTVSLTGSSWDPRRPLTVTIDPTSTPKDARGGVSDPPSS